MGRAGRSARGGAEEKAAALTAARAGAAQALGAGATEAVRRLGMPNAAITFAVSPAEPGPTGADDVQLLFSANPGEPPRPVARVASGGELSRLTLALRTVTAGAGTVPTQIFDEVDGGISGQAAQAVAEEMAALATHRQVFAVTHLVQMAAIADQHVHIRKAVVDGRTFTEIEPLTTFEGRAEELARLVGGSSVTAVTRQHALELLTTSAAQKENCGSSQGVITQTSRSAPTASERCKRFTGGFSIVSAIFGGRCAA